VLIVILDVHTHAMRETHWGCEWHTNWEPVYGRPADDVTVAWYDEAMAGVDLTFVFGIRATRAGVNTPHEFVADFVRESATRCIGFMALDPSDDDVLEQLRHGVQLGLRGIKLYPVLAHFDPRDERFDPFYRAATDAGLIVMWHMGATPSPAGRLDYSQPLVVDEVARRHPGLTQIIAHLGHPWQRDTVVVLRKNRRVFSDVSASWFRPADGNRALIRAQEWGVVDKLLFGSDFPIWTPAEAIAGLIGLGEMPAPPGVPRVAAETIDWLLHGDPRPSLGLV
jgi:predicted TIM-barrel fold metal-dependent hydrolase